LTTTTAPPSKSAVVVLRELGALRLGVEAFEHLLYQTGLDAAGLARLDEVAHGRVNPSVLVDAEDDRRVLAHFEFVDGRLRQKLAVDAYALAHGLADLLVGHLLHRLPDEFEVAVVGDAEGDLVPDVGEEGPGVVVDGGREHVRVGEADDAA